jgi:hypothetical protein
MRTIQASKVFGAHAMTIRNAIASVVVSDLKTVLPWYEALVGRGPDRVSEVGSAEWVFEQGGRLQLREEAGRAGQGSLTLAVGNLDGEVLSLRKWRDIAGDVVRTATERVLQIEDPDGNTITLMEDLAPAPSELSAARGQADGARGAHPLERALESIAADPSLSTWDVRRFLDNLILDLEAQLRATEENMSGTDTGLAAQLLQRAHVIRTKLATPAPAP